MQINEFVQIKENEDLNRLKRVTELREQDIGIREFNENQEITENKLIVRIKNIEATKDIQEVKMIRETKKI